MTLSHESEAGGVRIGDRFLEWKAVKSLTGFSRTTAWRRQKAGDFPTPRQISPGRVGWLESEVRAWQETRTPPGRSELPAFRPNAPLDPKPSPAPRRPAPPDEIQAAPRFAPKTKRRPRPIDDRQSAFDF